MKTPRQLERYLKGAGNHRRIEVLFLLDKERAITLEDISEKLNCSIPTLAGHTKSLMQAGLINKKYKGRFVLHSLSPFGNKFISFLKTF